MFILFKFIHKEFEDYKLLMRNVPSLFVSLYIVSVILMNLLAGKEVQTGLPWLVLDCGFLVSWMSFLTMDTITKRFGAKAATKLAILAVGVNMLCCGIMFLTSLVPGNWSEAYNYDSTIVNAALNSTIGGTWYVVVGSMTAFLTSAIVNNFTNSFIGKFLHKDNFSSYAVRSYISTGIGQFVDNFVFALLVSHVFFGWSMLQCVVCAVTGMLIELLCEVIFSPIGYRVYSQWKADDVGKDYLVAHDIK